ncbi:hypothetical protein K431DRAFT_285764 [Polychaeton citri CBS 116435]|uniref:Fibronectin type-III domain-containing protein n=1 Tax=Polychaeton citri CBS 116435 TaxID=1314669 RepID=A0A9P4Q6L0_9PEZI|nr:hypothetical protein K431DRAFT_285764 [Polychaeton citri CBS 116435]
MVQEAGSGTVRKGIFFGEAAQAAGKQLYGALPIAMDSAWARQLGGVFLTFVANWIGWFKPFVFLLSLSWIVYRASIVLSKPLDELAGLLGYDVPVKPIINLADVKADGVVVHWTLPDKQKGKKELRYDVYLNGNLVASVDFRESAVSISGLLPSSLFVVRIALVNGWDFASKSEAIRFRTKSAASGDIFGHNVHGPEIEGDDSGLAPIVRPYRELKDVAPVSPTEAAPAMMRQNSAALATRKSISGRKSSVNVHQLVNGERPETRSEEAGETAEGKETLQQLNERSDALRKEIDEAERLAKEEEDEELRLREELIKQRDALRAEVNEREKASRNLKREVTQLERQNTSAQNERTKQERLLDQKKQERQKLKDDLVRWEREAEDFRNDVERIKQEKIDYQVRIAEEKEILRARVAEEAVALRGIEDDIKANTGEMKKLERAAKSSSPGSGVTGGEFNLVQQMQQDAEEERMWQMRRNVMQQQYAQSVQRLEAMKHYQREQAEYLARLRDERRRQEAQQQQQQQQQQAAQAVYASPISQGPASVSERNLGMNLGRGDSTRSRRGTSGPNSNDSPRVVNFAPAVSQSPFSQPSTLATSSIPSAFTGLPFLNLSNGMTMALPTEEASLSDEDRDKLTGGAPMSPSTAAELLPADLFASELDERRMENTRPLPGLGGLPGLPALPGLGTAPGSNAPPRASTTPSRDDEGSGASGVDRGPASPASAQSRPASAFTSPRASSNNLQLGSPDNGLDSDRRSIKSVHSSRAMFGSNVAPAGSRFSSMFGIKPRSKNTSSTDDPNFGSLALGKTQSTSLPRQDIHAGLPGIDSATRKRNSSISGTHVFGGALNSKAETPGDSPEPQGADPLGRVKKPLTFFGFGKDKESSSGGWPSTFTKLGTHRPGSPRPDSTHSNELPRPSMDSSRWGVDAWPSTDSGARNSPLSFGPTAPWNPPMSSQGRNFGSRHPSRRPSVQYGASGPPDDIPEDELSDALEGSSEPMLAPIGTKPSKGKAPAFATPALDEDDAEADLRRAALNPAAKNFTSFLSSMKISKDRGDKDRIRENTPSASASNTPFHGPHHIDDESPPASRKSRDTRSLLSTTESSITASSSRNSADLARTPSISTYSDNGPPTPSPIIGSASTGKESLMQKITRKSSASKFSLPTFKRSDKVISSYTPPPSSGLEEETGTGDEAGMSSSLGSLPGRSTPGGDGSFPHREPRESKESARGSGRSWSSLLKVGKNKRESTGAPSISGFSLSSEAASSTHGRDADDDNVTIQEGEERG